MTAQESQSEIPLNHPRRASLLTRARLTEGTRQGITSLDGLIAHGRGEAFDYLLGEKTHDFASRAIEAAAALFLVARRPVISVNGNVAALIPRELVALSKVLGSLLEVNLFHANREREDRICNHLLSHGAAQVLLPQQDFVLPYLDSNRRFVNGQGIYRADVIFVPLEDGDRCEALIRSGRKVITIDLNPLSRTARKASITIVDNIIRAAPLLVDRVKALASEPRSILEGLLENYDNGMALREAEAVLRGGSG
ncbi:MAG TPA: phosphopantothenate/pantothenate synthetase [Blastocatellia bacterium]|jgi:4-phosphopantoate--beta-alanine ligase|nr:phosphopantothenate/pantothenate synthetase [Blastocatellia bacterium]